MTTTKNIPLKAGPSQKADTVAREALIGRLRAAPHKKLILVHAPAGFGKTTLLRQYWDALGDEAAHRVWVTLAAGDADPSRFTAALLDACRQAGGDLGEAAAPVMREHSASPDIVVAELAAALDRQSLNVLFFIDEYHNGESADVDALVKLLIQRTSPRIRIVLAARSEPACGAAKMRLDGDLLDVAHGDLAFDVEETEELFQGSGLGRPAIESLTVKTEGWPAALRLAKLWIGAADPSPDLAMSFSGDLPEIANYLTQEVFTPMPADIQEFLTETAILPFFDAAMADDILLRHDSERMLPRLEAMSAFVLPVDPARRRYRHHPLFADYLRGRLYSHHTADFIEDLHGRAADYFHRRGDLLYALEHAIEAADSIRVAEITSEPNCGLFWLTVDFNSFTRVMRKIDRNISDQLRIKPTYAFYLIKKGQFNEAREVLKAVKTELGERPEAGEPKVTRLTRDDAVLADAIYTIYTDEQSGGLISDLDASRRTSEIASTMYWGVLNNAHGMLLFREGKVDEADKAFEEAITHFTKARSHFSVIHNLVHRAMIAILRGDMISAGRFCDSAYRLHERHLPGDRKLLAIIDVARAELHYESGELKRAYDLFDTARTTIISGGDFWVELLARTFRMEARLRYANDGLDVALGLLGQGVDLARERKFERLEQALAAQRIHLAAIAENTDLAQKNAKENKYASENVPPPANSWRESAELRLALIRLDISCGRGEAALAALDKFDGESLLAGLEWFRLKARTLRALALFVTGQSQEAAALLRELLEMGDRLGLRSFVLEEGLLAQRLIDETARRYSKSKQADEFNKIVLEWLVDSSKYIPPDYRLQKPTLTKQQEHILRLLVRGLDRKEIADKADTTTHNVQYHLKKMFSLFNVTSSARLVAEAKRLGLADAVASTSF
jgi:ATP/maltotriose-dependent transcriptional regulator MalT